MPLINSFTKKMDIHHLDILTLRDRFLGFCIALIRWRKKLIFVEKILLYREKRLDRGDMKILDSNSNKELKS